MTLCEMKTMEDLISYGPEDILVIIFSYTGLQSFLSFTAVNRNCFNTSLKLEGVWRYFGVSGRRFQTVNIEQLPSSARKVYLLKGE